MEWVKLRFSDNSTFPAEGKEVECLHESSGETWMQKYTGKALAKTHLASPRPDFPYNTNKDWAVLATHWRPAAAGGKEGPLSAPKCTEAPGDRKDQPKVSSNA